MPLTPKVRKQLITAAQKARPHAYAPYSNYTVGAALLTADSQVFTGVNVENSAYSLTICAERNAVSTAISQGKQDFLAIALVTNDGGSPCGACRQVLSEFGSNIQVIIADEQGVIQQQLTVGELLPNGFGPNNVEISGA
jgi:cytidine deaminase